MCVGTVYNLYTVYNIYSYIFPLYFDEVFQSFPQQFLFSLVLWPSFALRISACRQWIFWEGSPSTCWLRQSFSNRRVPMSAGGALSGSSACVPPDACLCFKRTYVLAWKVLKRDWKKVLVESRECCFIFTRVARNLCCSNICMADFFCRKDRYRLCWEGWRRWPSRAYPILVDHQQEWDCSTSFVAWTGPGWNIGGQGLKSVPKDDYSISLPICLSTYVMYPAIYVTVCRSTYLPN